jgi:hypothetical protein
MRSRRMAETGVKDTGRGRPVNSQAGRLRYMHWDILDRFGVPIKINAPHSL